MNLAADLSDPDNAAHQLDLGIGGMTCASCVARAERVLKAVPGVEAAVVTLSTETAETRPLPSAPFRRSTSVRCSALAAEGGRGVMSSIVPE